MFILLHFDDQLRRDSLIVRSYKLYSMYYTYKAISPPAEGHSTDLIYYWENLPIVY